MGLPGYLLVVCVLCAWGDMPARLLGLTLHRFLRLLPLLERLGVQLISSWMPGFLFSLYPRLGLNGGKIAVGAELGGEPLFGNFRGAPP